jgi:tetratricopeptide (TPR) repeat protein
MTTLTMKCRLSFSQMVLLIAVAVSSQDCLLRAQADDSSRKKPDQTWAGQRIVTVKGFGDYFVADDNGRPRLVSPGGLGVNIVVVVQRVEGDRVWLKANGAGDTAVGWVNKDDVIALQDSVPYFTSLLQRNPNDWDAYLRRAESEHALNQRDTAIADYSAAIRLHPDESFLYLRRGREFRIMKLCEKAVSDFDQVIRLQPQWAEPYNLEAGVYSDCPETQFRSPEKAIELIEHAIALDVQHPTYLTVLALAYSRNGQIEKAVTTQRRALESPSFPPGYREEAKAQLQEYERALVAQKTLQH